MNQWEVFVNDVKELVKFELGIELLPSVERAVGTVKVDIHHFFEFVIRLWRIKMIDTFGVVHSAEIVETLNVIPVKVGNQKVKFTHLVFKMIGIKSYTKTRINNNTALSAGNNHACRMASVFERIFVCRADRAARTVKRDF